MAEIKECSSCGAKIIWVTTNKGKRMPLDADPSEKGTWGIGADGVAYYQEPSGLFPDMLHVTHWATCLNSKQHRKVR